MGGASCFNQTCRIYAPKYRQIHVGAFVHLRALAKLTDDPEARSGPAKPHELRQALDLAYSDIRRAFLHFVDDPETVTARSSWLGIRKVSCTWSGFCKRRWRTTQNGLHASSTPTWQASVCPWTYSHARSAEYCPVRLLRIFAASQAGGQRRSDT